MKTLWIGFSFVLCAACSSPTARFEPLGDEPPPPLCQSVYPYDNCVRQERGEDLGLDAGYCQAVFDACAARVQDDAGATYSFGSLEADR